MYDLIDFFINNNHLDIRNKLIFTVLIYINLITK